MTENFQTKIRQLRLLNKQQLIDALTECDAAVVNVKLSMENMSSRFKLRVAVPKLRDINLLRSHIQQELDRRS